ALARRWPDLRPVVYSIRQGTPSTRWPMRPPVPSYTRWWRPRNPRPTVSTSPMAGLEAPGRWCRVALSRVSRIDDRGRQDRRRDEARVVEVEELQHGIGPCVAVGQRRKAEALLQEGEDRGVVSGGVRDEMALAERRHHHERNADAVVVE